MITIENRLGKIVYSKRYLNTLVKDCVLGCYGISGLSLPQKSRRLNLKRRGLGGIVVKKGGKTVVIDVHIKVKYGLNVAQIVKSIKNKVGFAIKDNIGVFADGINVFVENVKE